MLVSSKKAWGVGREGLDSMQGGCDFLQVHEALKSGVHTVNGEMVLDVDSLVNAIDPGRSERVRVSAWISETCETMRDLGTRFWSPSQGNQKKRRLFKQWWFPGTNSPFWAAISVAFWDLLAFGPF